MSLINLIAGPVVGLFDDIIKRVIPDKAAQEQARLELLKLQQTGDLEDLKTRLSAILEEAKSQDPWTSRARPSFLYVMYIMILFSLPMGVLSVFDAQAAHQIAIGMQSWLGAIPDAVWGMFGAGYLGYTATRGYEKGKIITSSKGVKR
jgi:hypothetical protein